jgi:hypothetical protein
MKYKPLIRKPKMLLLVTLLGMAGSLPGAGFAAGPAGAGDYFSQFLDGDVRLAPVGHRGALHMSFKSTGDNRDAFSAAHADRPGSEDAVRLSIRLPWR